MKLTWDKINEKDAVIFDLDGTLVDSMWMWKQIDIEYLGRYGITFPEDLQSCIEGMSFSETAVYFKERFQIPDTIEEMMENWNKMAYEKYKTQVFPKKGSVEMLKRLKEKGKKIGIATSNSMTLVEAVLNQQNLAQYFDAVHTACEVEKGKPAPDIYLYVAKKLGVQPESCMAFEDVVQGIHAAKKAGMEVCAVYDEFSKDDTDEKKKIAEYYICDYTEIDE